MRRRIRESYANVRPLKHDFARLRASFAGGHCQCFELPIESARLDLQSRVFGSKTWTLGRCTLQCRQWKTAYSRSGIGCFTCSALKSELEPVMHISWDVGMGLLALCSFRDREILPQQVWIIFKKYAHSTLKAFLRKCVARLEHRLGTGNLVSYLTHPIAHFSILGWATRGPMLHFLCMHINDYSCADRRKGWPDAHRKLHSIH